MSSFWVSSAQLFKVFDFEFVLFTFSRMKLSLKFPLKLIKFKFETNNNFTAFKERQNFF